MPGSNVTDVTSERIHASALRFLLQGRERDAGIALFSCELVAEESRWGWEIELRAPRAYYDLLADIADPLRAAILRALAAVLPPAEGLGELRVAAELVDPGPNWRAEFVNALGVKSIHNMAIGAEKPLLWGGLRFRLASEMRVAQALDSAGVMFIADCAVRAGAPRARGRVEPDFLICHRGLWCILEVDGELFHPPTRTVHDHERDRLFWAHGGVRLVQHYDSGECFENAGGVVKQFLTLLEASITGGVPGVMVSGESSLDPDARSVPTHRSRPA
jgi:hypothetical protein